MTVFTCLHSAGSVLGGTSWLSFQDERLKSRQTLACDPIQCLKTQYECHLIHACVIVCVLVGGGGGGKNVGRIWSLWGFGDFR